MMHIEAKKAPRNDVTPEEMKKITDRQRRKDMDERSRVRDQEARRLREISDAIDTLRRHYN